MIHNNVVKSGVLLITINIRFEHMGKKRWHIDEKLLFEELCDPFDL